MHMLKEITRFKARQDVSEDLVVDEQRTQQRLFGLQIDKDRPVDL